MNSGDGLLMRALRIAAKEQAPFWGKEPDDVVSAWILRAADERADEAKDQRQCSSGLAVWKFVLAGAAGGDIFGRHVVSLPEGSRVLTVQVQGRRNVPTLWAFVDPRNHPLDRTFVTCATGETIGEDPGVYMGTCQLADGAVVCHVFEAVG